MRIGVLGGTFDPPHIGHLILAEQARDQLDLASVLWVPAGDPPHKQSLPISMISHRLEMVRMAIQDNPSFAISDVDIVRPGPHFSADMMELLQQKYPDSVLYFLAGSDSLHDLPSWHDPQRLIHNARLAIMGRSGTDVDLAALDTAIPGLTGRVELLDTPLVYVSGRDIRHRIANGFSARYLVPPEVSDYIMRNRLYLASRME
jgi:nicotinate-nucleotide adenylyltransferase